ncbi:amino acid transporter AVT1B [Odontomachus brunneus]|uniref:amino acid transporter AVT1B n=1 Tax=Odontomachus brunneus TaxID=486640 RepID=UPI0013F280A5|nr:amino acid transporter AVT1B [Odontomachus brunneus]XP_032684476.1 amino acid transporter AVT1B [Odontomachus brunneus]XP_032684477.1 amino acid transporter AVT1B [Odontomachus brunneus]
MNRETIPLIWRNANSGLSLLFATLCIVDIFGVFPIIALPCAIVQCGLYGIPLVLIVFGLQIYTATLLGRSWIIASNLDPQISRKNRYPLAAVTELTLGSRARSIVTVLLDLTVFGCGIPNLLVASQNLHLFGLKVSGLRFDLSFCYWLLIVGVLLCPLMWLGSPRDMKWVATCSSVAVSLTAILVWWGIITDDRMSNATPISTSPTWDKFISGYGMLAFQFDVHPTLMTIQVDMRRPRDIDKAVFFSFITSGSLFAVTVGLAVWKYGDSTTANILEAMPSGSVTNIAVLLAALQLCFSSVIGYSALFQHLEDQWSVQRTFGWKRCAMRSAVVLLSVAVGESVSRFDIVMALIGGSLTGSLVFVLPPLIYNRALALKQKSTQAAITREIHSSSRRKLSDEEEHSMDSEAHSRSIYYGFLSATNNSRRYTYLYYDDLTDDKIDSQSKEFIDRYKDDRGKGTTEIPLTNTHPEHPHLVDAAESNRIRNVKPADSPREEITEKTLLKKSERSCERMVKCFGYFIVAIGITITVSSTYVNVWNTIRYVRFTPPCIINATASQISAS